jgi:hypothetical protein
MSYFPTVKTTYRRSITSSDLNGGALTIQHNLNEDFPVVIIYNNDREFVMPDGILSLDSNSIYLVINSFGNIVGNWTIVVGK